MKKVVACTWAFDPTLLTDEVAALGVNISSAAGKDGLRRPSGGGSQANKEEKELGHRVRSVVGESVNKKAQVQETGLQKHC